MPTGARKREPWAETQHDVGMSSAERMDPGHEAGASRGVGTGREWVAVRGHQFSNVTRGMWGRGAADADGVIVGH